MRESGFLAGQQSEQSKVVEPISLPLPLVTSNWSTGAGEVVGGAPSGKCSLPAAANRAKSNGPNGISSERIYY